MAWYDCCEVIYMRLNDHMKQQGLTAQALSTLSGVSKRTVEQYTSERRVLANSKACIVIALADALKIHPRDLID